MTKYVVILGDGMPDYKVPQLDDRTPLEAARTPNMDFLAGKGIMGMVKTIPQGYPPGSDVANLSVMGYDPARYYTGRSPLEAVSMGVDLQEEEVAFRCNLVTLSEASSFTEKVMVDYSAGEISTGEAARLIEGIGKELGGGEFSFYPGISYRHLMVWKGGPDDIDLTPPHDISDQKIGPYLPSGDQGQKLRDLMKKSYEIFSRHPVNQSRREKGQPPANCIWLWGQGRKPRLKSFKDKYGLTGSVISAVDLIKGIGLCAGLEVVEVPGATGNIHTDFLGKAKAALEELEKGKDFIYLHVEAPDEAGHQGKVEDKIKAIEEIDEKVVGEILRGLENHKEYNLMVLSDHPTPLKIKTHVEDPVPFVIYRGKDSSPGKAAGFSEEEAEKTGIFLESGPRLMDYFLGKISCH
ncbi:MAG: cofactor-independent phosphoglycerate mutase [Candidatus Syntrophonatronum acetioxidans]|uniref:Cofactor-independent phosphoglycerate mutase n=1 Tax=Candidatus Syntrophonatronum acetioxidans TaxID=1795816 RepID=A0A424YA52_9FIRM|nr:MAG: cofactor-independent phosphoglycerate mutase [Candidatus Syntrophonatronum acetioxidans]